MSWLYQGRIEFCSLIFNTLELHPQSDVFRATGLLLPDRRQEYRRAIMCVFDLPGESKKRKERRSSAADQEAEGRMDGKYAAGERAATRR